MKIGILTTQHEEVEYIIEQLKQKNITERANRVFYEGVFEGVNIVVAFSHWGKVSAALTTSILLQEFKVDRLVSMGSASAVVPELNVGDIVVAQRLFQHDMDMRPLFRRYEIPLRGVTSFVTPENELQIATDAVHNFLKQAKDFRKELAEYNILAPKLQLGDIASGDLYITGASRKATINRNLPSVLCADMESAAIAHTCADFHIPCIVIRTIAEGTNEDADVELEARFKTELAVQYNFFIIRSLLQILV
ncbi:MAG TPA: 5'-methylthioadenosine/adenosylhomocysteine nucleosidase [Paludibacteraceae bacterium]|nr:5'-methylthioadenosine/adenosylhomocysteine nucleosidase [Paludibacteraceae bacterium]HQB69233.1 5'-methylthioadenosine/adenosylhomocysteine nucleosidase [Paludibacteraceae bacterium]HRS68111.1 5'-methylthioadenosine/adenosylhomocysteine nucleosidase [Paludibacteraceae bacterium]